MPDSKRARNCASCSAREAKQRRPLWEVSFKTADDPVYLPPDRWEGFQPQASIAERCLNGKLCLHLHVGLRARAAEAQVRDLHAIFEWFPEANGVELDREFGFLWLPSEAPGRLSGIGKDGECRMDRAMFVGVLVRAQRGERLMRRGVAARVRLQALDDRGVVVADALDSLHPYCVEAALGVEDGEADGFALAGNLPATQEHELIRQVVQGRAPVVQHIAEDEPEAQRRWLNDPNADNEQTTILASVLGDRVGVTVSEGVCLRVKRLKVFVRPTELRAGVL